MFFETVFIFVVVLFLIVEKVGTVFVVQIARRIIESLFGFGGQVVFVPDML
jgi:hypothetical protein